MSLSDIASIGSLVSGLAVLVSLVYLALQVRQAERNQRAALNQGTIERLTNLLVALSQPAVAGLLARIRDPEPNFSPQEVISLTLMQRATLLGLQDSLVQHRHGLIDQITLDNTVNAMKENLSWPASRILWFASRHSYAPELRTFVDALIADLPIAKPTDFVAAFNASIAQLSKAESAA